MKILFCSSPLDTKQVDPDYEFEYRAVKSIGLNAELINLEELLQFNLRKALSRVSVSESEELAIYRGWMLRSSVYETLYNELLKKNVRLINSPVMYKQCHYLPELYNKIKELTPKTVWVQKREITDSFDLLHQKIKEFNNNPVIIKDYVKSCKHQWMDACYIPDASDLMNFDRVLKNLINLRGDDFEGGVIVREFVNLEFLAEHPKSKMPLAKEFRLFFLNNQLLDILYYWDEAEYNSSVPSKEELGSFIKLAEEIDSKFFTIDIAKTSQGKWIIIELGDGQVSGLPYNADLEMFYIKVVEEMRV